METERESARSRALRAARVMSVAASLALGAVGCSMSHATVDSGVDAGPSGDGAVADSGVDSGIDSGVDAGACEDIEWTGGCCEPMPRECCETAFGGGWDESAECCFTCPEGPLTPPSAPV